MLDKKAGQSSPTSWSKVHLRQLQRPLDQQDPQGRTALDPGAQACRAIPSSCKPRSSDRGTRVLRCGAGRRGDLHHPARHCAEMTEFYTDIKTRMQARGRAPGRKPRHPAQRLGSDRRRPNRSPANALNILDEPDQSGAEPRARRRAGLVRRPLHQAQGGRQALGPPGQPGDEGDLEDVLNQHMKAQGLSFAQVAEKPRRRGRDAGRHLPRCSGRSPAGDLRIGGVRRASSCRRS